VEPIPATRKNMASSFLVFFVLWVSEHNLRQTHFNYSPPSKLFVTVSSLIKKTRPIQYFCNDDTSCRFCTEIISLRKQVEPVSVHRTHLIMRS
jgi:hypothetical protein